MATKTIAVVLAGAVARGAFEAGVIRALASADVRIVRIIAASSGALNGTLLAAAVRTGDVRGGAEALHTLWRDHAEWAEVFHPNLGDLIDRAGSSDQRKLLALLRDNVRPSQPAIPADINLRIVVAPLQGTPSAIGPQAATTYESICEFDSDAFATEAGLESVFTAATASAAFPLVFAPVTVGNLGPCVDGGTVNNTPVKWAIDGALGATIDAVVVVSTSVEQPVAPVELRGIGLIGHLAEMLTDERLYRDLRDALDVNTTLGKLAQLVQHGVIDQVQLGRVMDAIGWTGRRSVDLVRIRPVEQLSGNAFSGFFDKAVRVELLEAGFQRGQTVLRELDWLP
ncbi:MAG TPA: patatin-like phospholipase family protein [Kofleriaceae bacterium]|jgi:NTE family protein|nr:patatin-like phospholipase family protein [Kofleriaceae bacterium]